MKLSKRTALVVALLASLVLQSASALEDKKDAADALPPAATIEIDYEPVEGGPANATRTTLRGERRARDTKPDRR